jgi:hypothetical protein
MRLNERNILYVQNRMMKLQAKKDERLEALKEQVNNAVKIFVEAIPDMEERLSFKAFTLGEMPKKQAEALSDLILTQSAIALKEQVPDLMEKMSFACSTTVEDECVCIWLHACNVKPEKASNVELTEEDVHPLTKDDPVEEEEKVVEVIEDEKKDNVALVEVSAVGHVEPEKHIIKGATYDA